MKHLIIALVFMLPISLLANSISESTKNPPINHLEPCIIISGFETDCTLPLQLKGSIYKLSVCLNKPTTTTEAIEQIQNHICEFKEFPSNVTVLEVDFETIPYPGGAH